LRPLQKSRNHRHEANTTCVAMMKARVWGSARV
jgi:hypothetical protein